MRGSAAGRRREKRAEALRAVSVVLLASFASCTYPATATIVTLGTDVPPNRLHAIRAYVRRGVTVPPGGSAPTHAWQTDTFDGGSFLPASFTVVPGRDDPRDVGIALVVEADVDSTSPGTGIVTIRRLARFTTTPRVTTEIGFWLSSRCSDRTTGCTSVTDPSACTVSRRCEEQGLTCGDQGVCSSIDVMPHPPMGLPEAGPDVSPVPEALRAHVAISVYHACAIDPSHNVRCWGANSTGQRGDDAGFVQPAPTAHVVVDHAIAIGAGRDYSCALRDDGTVHCWGANDLGQLGDGTITGRETPAPVIGVRDAIAIATAQTHACAVLANGAVMCWGNGNQGQLGHGVSRVETTPVVVSGLGDASGVISASWEHTCVARRDGTAVCWGNNEVGQLGAEAPTGPGAESNVPLVVSGLADVVTLSAANGHTCASRRDGSLVCWGRDDFGERGPPGTPEPPPARFAAVVGLQNAVASVATGLAFTCAAMRDGSVYCFGLNDSYVVSSEARRAVPTPTRIPLSNPAVELVAGGQSACARDADGAIECWGGNTFRQLGDDVPFTGRASASTVPGLARATDIFAGGAHACALTPDGVFCWGSNNYGQLADLGPAPPDPRPIGWYDALQLGLGEFGSLVRARDGTVRAWGQNGGAPTAGSVVALPSPADEVASGGGAHRCARGGDTVWCWGANANGQLGDGTIVDRTTAGAVDLAGQTVVQVALGARFSCALTGAIGARSVRCWGANDSGQLGDGTMMERHVPTAAMTTGDLEEITAGVAHACVRHTSGAVTCWGANEDGELGRGSTSGPSAVPAPVTGLTDAVRIDAGDRFTCAVRATGGLACWGSNLYGQVGIEGMARVPMPLATTAIPTNDVRALAAGYGFACVIRDVDTTQCWGAPFDGRLGDGTASRAIPRPVANWP